MWLLPTFYRWGNWVQGDQGPCPRQSLPSKLHYNKHHFLCVLFSYTWHWQASKQSGTTATVLMYSASHRLCRQFTLPVIKYRNRNIDFQFTFVEWGMSEQQNKWAVGTSATDSKSPLRYTPTAPPSSGLVWLPKTVAQSSVKEGLLAWSGLVPTEVSINLTLGKRSPAHQHLKPGQGARWHVLLYRTLESLRTVIIFSILLASSYVHSHVWRE